MVHRRPEGVAGHAHTSPPAEPAAGVRNTAWPHVQQCPATKCVEEEGHEGEGAGGAD